MDNIQLKYTNVRGIIALNFLFILLAILLI